MIDKTGLEQAIHLKPKTALITISSQIYPEQLSLTKGTELPQENITIQLKIIKYDQKRQILKKIQDHEFKMLVTILIGVLIFIALIGYLNPQALTFIAPGSLLATLVGIVLRGKKKKDSDKDNKHNVG